MNREGSLLTTQVTIGDILTRARAVLSHSKVLRLRGLAVYSSEGQIILRGKVPLFYHKQLAQELVRMAVEGVEVVNLIDVVYRPEEEDGFPRAEWF